MSADFAGRVAVITGAGHGLGREYALALAARGARVVVNDLRSEGDGAGGDAAETVVREITAAQGTAVADHHAVGTADAAGGLVATALGSFGRIDVLICSAAVPPQSGADVTIGVDVLGALHTAEAVWPVMKSQGYGRIVTTTSPVGLFGFPAESGRNAYASAKMAMVGLARNLGAMGAAHGIHANAIAPWASTRRMDGMPPDERAWMAWHFPPRLVAPAVLWLAHERCQVNGEVIGAAGGRVARIFIAETRGYHAPDLSVEDLLANAGAVLDAAEYFLPASSDDELALIRTQLGIGRA